MERKRSKGVTFWAWFFIISSIWVLFHVLSNAQNQIQLYGIGLFVLGIISSIVYLIAGFSLFKLKEIGRIVAIFLSVISISSIPFYLMHVSKRVNFDDVYAKKEKMIVEQFKSEYQQAELEKLQKVKKAVSRAMPIFVFGIVGLPFLIIELLPIYFFTRPKVREQFRRAVTSESTL